MYCPKCGTDNPATNLYCRACREELRLVAQAMKKSLPVKLAGKLDAVFDSKAERFRRDSVLSLLLGLGGSAALLWAALAGNSLWFPALITILGYEGSLWEYLAYKRSLVLRKELDSLVSTSVDSPNYLTTLRLSVKNDAGPERRDEAAKAKGLRYCPRCGTGGQGGVSFCRTCGVDLQAVRGALGEESRRSWLGKKLDAYVRRRSADRIGGAAAIMISLLFVLTIIVPWFGDESPRLFNKTLLALYLFIGLWDYLVYRRRLTPGSDLPVRPVGDAQAISPTKEDTALPPPDQIQEPASRPDTPPFSIVEEPTQKMWQDRGHKI